MTLPGASLDTWYTYGNAQKGQTAEAVYVVSNSQGQQIEYSYDALGRLSTRRLYVPNKAATYTYEENTTTGDTSSQVKTVTDDNGTTTYTYDAAGRITGVTHSGSASESYTYDALGQLTAATIGSDHYVYSYDANGNRLTASKNGTSVSYAYADSSWKDLLTSYAGQTITYDSVGHPLNYRNGMTMQWNYAGNLTSLTGNGHSSTYAYDESGYRFTKTVDGTTTQFYALDNVLYGQKTGSNMLVFLYDDAGSAYGFKYNGTAYYYDRNLQGDVTGIYTAAGTKVVTYTYDPYGAPLTTTDTTANHIGIVNPLRYRGYYYDAETGLYYLQSRYYDPTTGRFISADTTDVIEARQDEPLGLNLFAYCDNNPVNYCDPTGEILISTCVLIGIGIGALIGGVAGGLHGYNQARKAGVPPKDRWKYVVGYGLGGVIIGGIIGGFMGYGIGFLCGATSTSGVALRAISKGISGITKQTWGHLFTKEHAWNLVMKNVTQNGVKSIISQALKKGATTLIDKMVKKGVTSMIYETVYPYMGQKIIVHYAVIDGIIKISDAWVKTR